MPLLQVKECPEKLYEELRAIAEQDRRSMAQQVVVALDTYMADRKGAHADEALRKQRRRMLLDKARASAVSADFDPVQLVREIRDER